jgi:predicted KAP-like P-loop ATPase
VQWIAREVAVFGQEQGKFGGAAGKPEDTWLLTKDQLRRLESEVLDRIRCDAERDALLGYQYLPALLHYWSEWANADEPRAWAERVTVTEGNLIAFIEKFLSETITETLEGTPQRWKTPRLDPEILRPFVDLETTIARARLLTEQSLFTDSQRAAVRTLVKEYDDRQRGIDPTSPLYSIVPTAE